MLDKEIKWYNDTVIYPEPFTAICNMLAMFKSLNKVDTEYVQTMDPYAKNVMNLFEQFFFMPENIAKAKMVHVDKELLQSLIHTDNKVFFRNTGLPVMFINQDFRYENYLIKGIMISNTKELSEHMHPTDLLELVITHPNEQVLEALDDLMIMTLYIDVTNDQPIEQWLAYSLTGSTYTRTKSTKLRKYVSNIVCNILDFMNNDTETIDINIVEIDKVRNDKRIIRGKPPIPAKVYIRPKSEYRTYYISFNNDLETRHRTHRYLVRGHWRHFRSSKWVKAQGQSVWIKPQVRGKGIFIEKKYKLEGGD